MAQGWDYLRGRPGAEQDPDLVAARRALAAQAEEAKAEPQRPSPPAAALPAQSGPSGMAHKIPEDSVGTLLQVAGWILLALSAIVLAITVYDTDTDAGIGLAIGFGGIVQSLLLIGFGRMVTYMKATALLLAEAVDQQRAG